MTGLEAMILKELVTWGAKMVFDSNLSKEAQKAIIENLPRHLKL